MRTKIKVMARDDVQLRVFARNNAIPLEHIARVMRADEVRRVVPGVLFCLPACDACSDADAIRREWSQRGGRFVDVPVTVVLGREKMEFSPKHKKS